MTFKNTNNSFTTKFENSTTLQKVADLSGNLPFSDRLVSILNFEEHSEALNHFQFCFQTVKNLHVSRAKAV